MNTANPYAAPTTLQRHSQAATQETVRTSAVAMYSPSQIAAATFLGGTVAGGILMAGNAARRGRTGEAVMAVLGGMLATVAVVAAALMMPIDLPGMLYLLLSTMATWGVAKAVQGAEYDTHIAAGGATAKGWKPVAIALGTGLVVGGALFAFLLM